MACNNWWQSCIMKQFWVWEQKKKKASIRLGNKQDHTAAPVTMRILFDKRITQELELCHYTAMLSDIGHHQWCCVMRESWTFAVMCKSVKKRSWTSDVYVKKSAHYWKCLIWTLPVTLCEVRKLDITSDV